jgi:hypothetical protein
VTVRGRVVAALALGALAASCAGPPWYMGEPLDGHPSVPPTRAHLSFRQQRAEAARAGAAGEPLLELRALLALDEAERLTDEERARLVTQLEQRARMFHALGRPIAESGDLERVARLAPARGAGLLEERAGAARAAGDAWLAVGALAEARVAYERARGLGASEMDFRVRALWGQPPSDATPLAELRAAITALPLRAVGPVASVYLARGGSERGALERALSAARQEHLETLAVRAELALADADAKKTTADGGAAEDGPALDAADPGDDGGQDGGTPLDAAPDADLDPDAALRPLPLPVPANLGAWMLGHVCISARLMPLANDHPEILDDVPRAVRWIDLALDEDATTPETLELAAYVFGRARRLGGTERMLMELAYATPDRAVGLARGAAVWERLARPREACAQWIRAAKWRDDPEDPLWRQAIGCARRDPGAGDWRELRGYVLGRARPERRASLAATLDAS